jgi:hypothetical protein
MIARFLCRRTGGFHDREDNFKLRILEKLDEDVIRTQGDEGSHVSSIDSIKI